MDECLWCGESGNCRCDEEEEETEDRLIAESGLEPWQYDVEPTKPRTEN